MSPSDEKLAAESARLWNGNADLWARELASGQDRYRHLFLEPAFLAFLGDVAGLDVLDAACGEGTSARLLARQGARVAAFDVAPRMVELAVERERAEPLGIAYRQASFDDLSSYADASFDRVTCWMALMDVGPLQGALAECHRVLRPEGVFAFAIAHPHSFTPGMQIAHDRARDVPVLTVSGYFTGRIDTSRWSFAGSDLERQGVAAFAALRFRRTVADYVSALLAAGFEVTAYGEPRPSEAACKELPRLGFWREHAPLYLFLAGRKR